MLFSLKKSVLYNFAQAVSGISLYAKLPMFCAEKVFIRFKNEVVVFCVCFAIARQQKIVLPLML